MNTINSDEYVIQCIDAIPNQNSILITNNDNSCVNSSNYIIDKSFKVNMSSLNTIDGIMDLSSIQLDYDEYKDDDEYGNHLNLDLRPKSLLNNAKTSWYNLNNQIYSNIRNYIRNYLIPTLKN